MIQRIIGVLVFTLLIGSTAAWAEPPVSGAIFTTDYTCTQTNGNIYAAKTAVYLDGGPQHPGAAGLPDGSYYVQVTNPSGATVLGTSVGTTNEKPITVSNGEMQGCLQLWSLVEMNPPTDTSPGFADTGNPGGEYKVWVSNESSFQNNSTKTDNFKVLATQPPPQFVISGYKFYDANADGIQNNGEVGIRGWEVTIFGGPDGFPSYTTTTDASGLFQFPVDPVSPGETYGVCEVLPTASPTWVNTTPKEVSGLLPGDSSTKFGNVCLGANGGLTLGFWSNKNGQSLIAPTSLCALTWLNLRNANGSDFDPVSKTATGGCPTSTSIPNSTLTTSGKTNLKNWLLSATATNMAYMLSAQFATMKLNTLPTTQSATPFVDPGSIVYAPGAPSANAFGFTTITALMDDANASLAANPVTTSASPARTLQETLKNALDKANNNKNFVQPSPCEVLYSPNEPSCVPAQ